jgi:hypothetical protein
VAVWAAAVTLFTALMPAESPLAVAGSTLAVAALFNPNRRRVQDWVDRRFNRTRYDARRVADRFTEELRDQVDSARIVAGWKAVVAQTMQPTAIGVWIGQAPEPRVGWEDQR